MTDDKIKVRKLTPLATFDRAHEDDVGYDLTCTKVILTDGGGATLHLGVVVQPPEGTAFRVYPRSSFPKTGWFLSNSVGVIDPGYRGEWLMKIVPWKWKNADPYDFVGKKVAQAVLYNTMTPAVEEVDELDETERGVGGFGSTG